MIDDELKPGDLVRMTRKLRTMMRWGGSRDHVREFGWCVGVVVGPTTPGCPEVDVRWRPQ